MQIVLCDLSLKHLKVPADVLGTGGAGVIYECDEYQYSKLELGGTDRVDLGILINKLWTIFAINML